MFVTNYSQFKARNSVNQHSLELNISMHPHKPLKPLLIPMSSVELQLCYVSCINCQLKLVLLGQICLVGFLDFTISTLPLVDMLRLNMYVGGVILYLLMLTIYIKERKSDLMWILILELKVLITIKDSKGMDVF